MGLLPTRDKISRFGPNIASHCPICGYFQESALHIFWYCPLARALWFGCEWGIRTDHYHLENVLDLIENLTIPSPELHLPKSNEVRFTLMGAIIMDQIWKSCNLVVHENQAVDISHIWRSIHSLNVKHQCMPLPQAALIPKVVSSWSPPPHGWLKFNCDSAFGLSSSALAVTARDWRGIVVLAMTLKAYTTIPLQVEADTILWAGHLTVAMGVEKAILESDSKSCVIAISDFPNNTHWRLHGFVSNFHSIY